MKGHEVTFLTTGTLAPRVPKNVNVVELPLDGNRNNPAVLWKLWRELNNGQFDIVHAQGSKAAQMVTRLSWALPRHLKTIGTLHNQKKNIAAFRKLDHAIGVSNVLSRDINRKNCTTIYHGLRTDFLRQEPMTIERSGRPVILAVGRLVEAKGFDLLLSAWTDIEADLLILGDGPDQEPLKKQVNQLGLEDKVVLLGRSESIAGYMKSADGVVVSSRREGFSYVVAEALLCECPVVSTDVPVANEVLDQSLIMKTDPASMAVKISELVADIRGWRKKCERSFLFAKEQFVYDNMLEKTEVLYSKILEHRHQ